MIRHLLRLAWNRKGANLLVTAEIFVSFLVLFAVVALGVYYVDNYSQPLGFSYQNVWRIAIEGRPLRGDGRASGDDDAVRAAAGSRMRELVATLGEFSEIVSVAAADPVPYTDSRRSSSYERQGRNVRYRELEATDSFLDVMGLTITRGRWFGREDDALPGSAAVITERLAREVFGDADPLGQNLAEETDSEGRPIPPIRVVGVISEFRQDGEYAGSEGFVVTRARLEDPEASGIGNFLVKVRPGAGADLEARMAARLQSVAPDWSFKVESLAALRDSQNGLRLAPVLAVGTIAAFLLLMVALGLTGVLWQSVTQRTKEIGLRRAKGASARGIHVQILGEVLVMTTMALLLGVIVVVQLPLLSLVTGLSAPVYAASLAISVVSIYVLTVACGYYPSRLATRLTPAEALHYE